MGTPICPIMSRNFQSEAGFNLPVTEEGFVECQESKCVLWVSVWTTETGYSEKGCAFALNAMKNSEGKIVV